MNEYGYERVENNHSRHRRPTLHAFGCVVDGGTERNGRGWFVCPRCVEHAADDGTENVLMRLDRLAPKYA